jgi:hypothetical protein
VETIRGRRKFCRLYDSDSRQRSGFWLPAESAPKALRTLTFLGIDLQAVFPPTPTPEPPEPPPAAHFFAGIIVKNRGSRGISDDRQLADPHHTSCKIGENRDEHRELNEARRSSERRPVELSADQR